MSLSRLLNRILPWVLTLLLPVHGAEVFFDGFESGSLGPQWTLSTTGTGRARVSSEYEPATGLRHLVLDDSVTDLQYSLVEATLALNLQFQTDTVLQFKVKSLGNDPNWNSRFNGELNREFDGISVSYDNGQNWEIIGSLAETDPEWTSIALNLPLPQPRRPGENSDVRVRFSFFDNLAAPNDGIALDDVRVLATPQQVVDVEIPRVLTEGSKGNQGLVLVGIPSATPVEVALVFEPTNRLQAPRSVTIPPGAITAPFEFAVDEDTLLTGIRSVMISAKVDGAVDFVHRITILDNEPISGRLELPARLREGGNLEPARLVLDQIAGEDLEIELVASPDNQIHLSRTTLILPANESAIEFKVQAAEDQYLEAEVQVRVAARLSGRTFATSTVAVDDNEPRELSLSLPPFLSEGQVGSGEIRISAIASSNLTVTLRSTNAGPLGFPPTVQIPAGISGISFPVSVAEDDQQTGTRRHGIVASLPGFNDSSLTTEVRDNEAVGYRFVGLPDFAATNDPISVAIRGIDIEGNVIAAIPPKLTLQRIGSDGGAAPLKLSRESPEFGDWFLDFPMPADVGTAFRLRVTEPSGRSFDSHPVELLRKFSADGGLGGLVYDQVRHQLYASVNQGTNSGNILVLNPDSLIVEKAIRTGQNPGQLAITTDAQYLYASLDANGTIAKIDLSSQKTIAIFPVGSDPSSGTLYADDLAVVTGQPELLIVSRYSRTGFPRHHGVAAYRNGRSLGLTTEGFFGRIVIEPSADPEVFYGFPLDFGDNSLRRLRLVTEGIREEKVDPLPQIARIGSDFKAAGNLIFGTSGLVLDGRNAQLVTNLSEANFSKHLVAPVFESRRVYYLEFNSFQQGEYFLNSYNLEEYSNLYRFKIATPFGSLSATLGDLIRWGTNGLAFRQSGTVVLLASNRLVPSRAEAELGVGIAASPGLLPLGTNVTYQVVVTNHGPTVASRVTLNVQLSEGQTVVSAPSEMGGFTTLLFNSEKFLSWLNPFYPFGQPISLAGIIPSPSVSARVTIPELSAGASRAFTIVVRPQLPGTLSCSAYVTSEVGDHIFKNNRANQFVSVGFEAPPLANARLRIAANNLVYDKRRKAFWISVPAQPNTSSAPWQNTILRVDPITGWVTQPIPLGVSPYSYSMAQSANGKFLYVGLETVPEVARIDLETSPPTVARILLGTNQWGSIDYAEDIEPLEGAGTSFVVTTRGDRTASVFDGDIRRSMSSDQYAAYRLESSATPGALIALSGDNLTRLVASPSGIASFKNALGLVQSAWDIATSGNLLLTSTGRLIDTETLTLKYNFELSGRGLVDADARLAVIASGSQLHAFDTVKGLNAGTRSIPVLGDFDWAKVCVRWGDDGIAILGGDGYLHVLRWPEVFPQGSPLLSLAGWRTKHFGTSNADLYGDPDQDGIPTGLEFLHGTSPVVADAAPIAFAFSQLTGRRMVTLEFPRRKGIEANSYTIEASNNLSDWEVASNLVETVISEELVDGLAVERVRATILAQEAGEGYVRLKWIGR